MEFLIPLSFGVVTTLVTYATRHVPRMSYCIAGWGLFGTFILCLLCM